MTCTCSKKRRITGTLRCAVCHLPVCGFCVKVITVPVHRPRKPWSLQLCPDCAATHQARVDDPEKYRIDWDSWVGLQDEGNRDGRFFIRNLERQYGDTAFNVTSKDIGEELITLEPLGPHLNGTPHIEVGLYLVIPSL